MKKSIIGFLITAAFLSQICGFAVTARAQKLKTAKILTTPQATLLTDNFESYQPASPFPAGSWVNHNSSTAVWAITTDGTQVARQTAATTCIISNGDTAWTNYTVSARVKASALGFRHGIIARFTNTSSYYSFYLRSTSTGGTKVIELNKRTAAGNNVLQTVSVPIAAGVYYKLALEVDGSTIKGYVDDVLKVQVTDTDYAAGKIGFYNTGDTFYDDLSVTDSSTPPPAPTSLTATGGSSQIGLSWTAASGAASYTVKRSAVDGGPYQTIASNVTALTYTDTTVANNTPYYYVVTASNAAGESANSNQASATAVLAIPGIPGSLLSASGNGEARIYWTGSSGAASYNVKRSLASSGTYTTVGTTASTEFTDTGLTNGTTYYYRVSAVNAAGESANSGVVIANPRAGQVVNVASQTQLTAALGNAVAGDEIILTDGNYSAFKVRRKYGTAENPIIVRAQNPLGAVFNAGQLELDKTDYLTFQDFRFTLSTNIKLRGTEHNRLTRNSFEFNETGLTDLDWISMGTGESNHNRIDHNDFKNKFTLGNFIVLVGDNGQVSQYDLIDHNYFFNLGPRADNEKEAIRLGDSSISQSNGYTTLEYNLFEQCDGDPEIVSIKTNDNIVRYNTFRRSKGALTARQGNRSLMYGNFFLGEGVADTGGIRAYGNDHKIFNNYFEGLTASDTTGNYSAISITNGDADGAELPGADQSKHYRPQRILIANNTLVGNLSNIEIGGSYTLAPRDITFANNIVVGSTNPLYRIFTAPLTSVFAGNIAFPSGTATVGMSATDAQIRVIDPLFVTENNLQKLGAGSPAIDASLNNYDFLTEDFEGQTRDALRDAGADEFGAFNAQRLPLVSANAGLNSNNYAISGRVVNASGQGIGAVKVVLTNNQAALSGTTAAATETDAGGYFSITDIAANENYTLSFSKNQYSFSPAAISVSNLSSDVNLNINGALLAPTAARVSVSGKVLNGASVISNAVVSLTNQSGESISVRTNSFGNFNFEVAAGQTYLLSAQSKGCLYDPQIVTVTDSVGDLIISALPE
ncbi:MAG TPA: chondroitinase-B domain-containing protein [Pyrinomonadaceae bacterium]|nr:chondroitinase-B domain-containing protein [Pyrinomonadaceae bacterium]